VKKVVTCKIKVECKECAPTGDLAGRCPFAHRAVEGKYVVLKNWFAPDRDLQLEIICFSGWEE